MTVLVGNEEHPSVEYECIRRIISLVKAEKERVYALAKPTVISIPGVIITKEGGGAGSVKVASIASYVVVEINNRMNILKSLLFTVPVFDHRGKVDHLMLATISDEVKQLFKSTSAILEQMSLASDEMAY